jgi:ribonuclease HI
MEYYAFSDGGCINNGKKNAIASYCAILIDGKTKHIKKGLVMPNKYILNLPIDDTSVSIEDTSVSIEDTSVSIEDTSIISIDETIKITPSNNRGELLGIIYCFIQLYLKTLDANFIPTKVELYSDSLICIKTFNIWLPSRKKKNTAHELKNFDLIQIADILLSKIKIKYTKIAILHVKSHQKKPISGGNKTLFIWLGNQLADTECGKLLN